MVEADRQNQLATRGWGRSGIETSALGLGCWAIGGTWRDSIGNPLGWGETDDRESIAAIRRALELGATFFDTADVYGAGHSERILGQALRGHRGGVVIASKWGNLFDEDSRVMTGVSTEPEYVRPALLASLKRLDVEHLDLYQLHLSHATHEEARALRDACDELVQEGLIRWYAWSTDDPQRAAVFAAGDGCAAVQYECSVLHDAPEMIALAESNDIASINRSPLAMGLLSGKYSRTDRLAKNDIRGNPPAWLRFFAGGGASSRWVAKVNAISEILRSNGRTPAQGALAWLCARSGAMIPIPGFRTVEQVEENLGALRHGPLTPDQMWQIEQLMGE